MSVFGYITDTFQDDEFRAECQRYKAHKDQDVIDKFNSARDFKAFESILSLIRRRMGKAGSIANQITRYKRDKEMDKPNHKKRIENYINNGVSEDDARDTYDWYKNFQSKVETTMKSFQK